MTWGRAGDGDAGGTEWLPPGSGYTDLHLLVDSPYWVLLRARREDGGSRSGGSALLRLLKRRFPRPRESTLLRHELEITQRLALEGVVRGVSVVEYQERLFLVLDDPGGQPLTSCHLPLRSVVALGIRLAVLLRRIHERQVIHKSVQPRSLLYGPESGTLCLTDFTLASSLAHERQRLRSPLALEGALAYMSPEQTGRANRSIDFRSDFYSAGVTLYQMLTGRLPFDGDDPMEVVHGHLARRPVPPCEIDAAIPPALSAVVERLLAKNAEERYQSTAGWQADLEACLAELDGGPPVKVDDLGRSDVSAAFLIPQRLYGREQEREALLTSFDRVAQGPSEWMGVAGPSGIGKTFLVHELLRPMTRARGWFVAGKYDPGEMGVPYSGLVQAFTDLVHQVLTESPHQVERWRAHLLEALGTNTQVMVEVIPDLALVVGELPPVPVLPPGQARARFARTFLDFVRVIAAAEHPLVVFLDDLQWADAASLKWVQMLLGDRDCEHVLLVGAWRDHEVGPSHPLPVILEELRREGTPVPSVVLGPLDAEHVTRMVADTLGCTAEQARPLAELLWQRTHGNPFFVHHLFGSLATAGLVVRDPASARWVFDLDAIRAVACSENVAEFMAGEVAQLPTRSREVLAAASCFGNRFGLARLADVLGLDAGEVADLLRPCVERGLIEPEGDVARFLHESPRAVARMLAACGDDGQYRFVHDRVRHAVDALLDEPRRQHLHLRIGRMLLASIPPEHVEARIFDIVSHLNAGLALVTAPDERRTLAELNFMAGSRGRDTTAYEAALEHLTLACRLLADDPGTTAPDMAFDLFRERALCEGLCGNLDQADAYFERAVSHARGTAERLEVGITQIGLYTLVQRKHEAVSLGLRLLREVGIHIPEHVGPARLAWEMARVRWLRGRRRPADLADLPLMTDPTHVATATLLMELCKPTYTLGRLHLMTALALRLVGFCLVHGNTGVAAFGYDLYGMILGSTFGAYETALEFGRLGLELNQRFEDRLLRSAVHWQVAFALLPWRAHVRNCARYFREGYLSGVQCGDTFYAAASVCSMGTYMRVSGVPQDEILGQVEQYRAFMRWSRERNYYQGHLLLQQDALCLLGRTESVTSLDDASFDEGRCVAEMEDDEYLSGICFYAIGKLRLFLLYGDLVGATAMAQRARETVAALALTLFEPEFYFYDALLSLALLADSPPAQRRRHWRKVGTCLRRMAHWARHCPDNFLHKRLFLEAEVARVRGKDEEALQLFARTIDEARRTEFLQHEALAHERVAALHRARGRTDATRSSLRAACYAYRKWGAYAKVARLEQTSPELWDVGAAGPRETAPTEALPMESLSSLDAWSMVRATQSISTEIAVPSLLSNLMARLMENAGAERVVLLLVRDGALELAAVSSTHGEVTVMEPPQDPEGWVPLAVVRYAERTGRPVLVEDAGRHDLFGSDPYVVSERPRSVLCAPILHRGVPIGVIYVENRLIAGAFTEQRLQVLGVLAAQAAISLENARLIEQLEESNRLLEQRVVERTAELSEKNKVLRATQNELVQKQKMAWMGTLTQGIAHEIRNPLGLVKNFAEVTQEVVGELRSHVHAEEGGEELLDLAERNLGRIRENVVRADEIVKSMLMHSPDGPTDVLQPVALNPLLTSLAESMLAHARRAPVALVLDLDETLEPIDGVVRELTRAFTNLLQNALDALEEMALPSDPSYRPCVRICTRELGTHVEMRIRDNGPGIAPEHRERIFAPFFTTRATGRGTGLGLSLTYDILVHGHGGEMTLDTEVGSHTEFLVRLPRRAPLPLSGLETST